MSQPQLLDGRYRVVKKLSEGGFGVTYLARDTRRPGEPICVGKELRHEHQNNPKIIQLFHQEAEMLEQLGRHDQIPQLLASFHDANRLYLIQEYIDGVTVYDELLSPSGKQRKTEAEVVAILRDVLTALAFVHEHRVVHRDIKPANLMRRKRDGKIMLIDFGAVKALSQSQVQSNGQITTTVSIGSPGYSPHEQISQGNPRPASDIYALGVTVIEALTGINPTEMWTDPSTAELVWRERAQVSVPLADFLTQMVRHHFSRRFQDAGAGLKALEALMVKSAEVEQPVQLPVRQPNQGQQPELPTDHSREESTRVAQGNLNSAPPDRSRREMLKFLGFSVAGVAVTLGGQRLLRSGETANKSALLETVNFQTVQVNAQGEVIAQPSGSATYFDEPYLLGKLRNALPLRMMQIPEGEFIMGSPDGEVGWDNDEGPQRQVTVTSFFMGAFTITQRQYQEIMGENPSRFTDGGADRPVERVDWDAAVTFCEKLNEQTEATYRLPSEAEWEYACRAGTTTPFTFGETLTTEIANYAGGAYGAGPQGESRNTTVAVNNFPANAFGLYNMHGNVCEWCQDDWSNSYNGAPSDSKPWITGRAESSKMVRGGSCYDGPRVCRSASRSGKSRGYRGSNGGFRVMCILSQ